MLNTMNKLILYQFLMIVLKNWTTLKFPIEMDLNSTSSTAIVFNRFARASVCCVEISWFDLLVFSFQDSLLASPIILDLIILCEICERIQFKVEGEKEFQSFNSVLSILSYLLKAPLVPKNTPLVNALFKQRSCIENIFRYYTLYICFMKYITVLVHCHTIHQGKCPFSTVLFLPLSVTVPFSLKWKRQDWF